MSIIAAGTTTTTALSSTGNTDGTLQFQVNGTTPSVTLNTLGAIGVGSTPNFGTAGQALVSAGSTAAPTWASVTTSPAGSNTQIQYNNSGSFGASSGLTFDGTKLALSSSSAAVLESIKSTSTTSQSALFQVNNDADVPFNIGVFGSSAGTFGVLGASTPFISTNASTLNLVNTNASGSVVLGLGSSATERFRFASAGQLGIGGANYGTSGQVLTSGGASAAPTWASPSSGMTLISTTNFPSGSGTWTVTSPFSSSYSNYIIYIDNIRMSGNCDMIYYGWNGTTQQDPAAGCALHGYNAAGQIGAIPGSVYLNLPAGAITTAASYPFNSVMFINRYSGQSFYSGTFNSAYKDSPNDQTIINGSFIGLDTGAYDSFQLVLTGSQTFTQGKIFVYGLQ